MSNLKDEAQMTWDHEQHDFCHSKGKELIRILAYKEGKLP